MTADQKSKKKPVRKPCAKVLLRLDFEERDKLNQKAVEAGLSVNQFLKKLIKGIRIYQRDDTKKELARALNTNLNRLNANLNMLAKHANTYREDADAVLLHVRLKQIHRDLQQLVKQGSGA